MTKAAKKTTRTKKAAVKTAALLPSLPDGMTYATEHEIKQWIIREFRMMDYDIEVRSVHLQRHPLRIPNWSLLRVAADGELLRRFMVDGPHKKLQNGLYLLDKKPS
jgi:hypothetical protein